MESESWYRRWREEMGARIQTLRKRAKLSQSQLARKAGVPLSTLRDWEHGRRYMRLEAAMKLADALDLTLDELAGRKGKKREG